MKSVQSSTVKAYSFDPATRNLDVEFHSGRKYRYEGVDKKTYAELEAAKSKGSFFHSSIMGKHTVIKL
jgi:hypothetical protein